MFEKDSASQLRVLENLLKAIILLQIENCPKILLTLLPALNLALQAMLKRLSTLALLSIVDLIFFKRGAIRHMIVF